MGNVRNPVILSVIHHHQNPLESTGTDIRLEVFTAVTMKNAVFWDVVP
jgi:hypothetical protein